MKHLITFLIMALLAMSAVSAVNCTSISEDVLQNDIKLPGAIPYKNERINLEVAGVPAGYAIIQDRLVTEFKCQDSLENSTYDVKVSEWALFEEIANSEKIADRLNKAFKEKEIVLEGKSPGKKMKGFFTRLAVRLGSWFS